MHDFDTQRPLTPRHHPTAGVKIDHDEIETITSYGFPQSELISITELPSGKSFNNRIYFIKLRHCTRHSTEAIEQDVVLKVNGRFFGANKIQNEVGCFHLLNEYCPDIPTPRTLAWSGDGSTAIFSTPFASGPYQLQPSPRLQNAAHGGWILMTKLPGDIFDSTSLNFETVVKLGMQLGDIVASWRQKIPIQSHCGNICLPCPTNQKAGSPATASASIKIHGILQEGIHSEDAVGNTNEYYRLKLVNKVHQLESMSVYAPNRSLLRPLKAFISEKLPHLELDDTGGAEKFVFTHYDLSPRNVLVGGQPPQILGIIDFEFSGFFPTTEEFLNDYIGNNGDWPRGFYEAYLDSLETKEIVTPKKSMDPKTWKRCYWLETLVSSIAPWYLPGNLNEYELQEELRRSEYSVRQMLERLNHPEDHWEERIEYGEQYEGVTEGAAQAKEKKMKKRKKESK
ncbi:hypothetical protein BGZ63DRAFT_357639 [Mariannaea sp. PMI_226]|nr:hypothetical protein BGZ63DRAFT_357639 [Mariannaea sp. PMI_226]